MVLCCQIFFFHGWSRLDLFSLPLQGQQEPANSGVAFEAATYFEYGKMEEGYWTGENLLEQIKAKALSIAEALYLISDARHWWINFIHGF